MTKFKIGQTVRIIANSSNHQFEIGELVRIMDINSISYTCENSDGWRPNVLEEDIELINDQPIQSEKQPNVKSIKRFKIGDHVKVKLPNISGHSFADNEILKVIEPSIMFQQVWKCERLDGSDFHYLYECEMEPIDQPEQQSTETAVSIWNRLNPVWVDLQLVLSETKAFFKDWPNEIEWMIDESYRPTDTTTNMRICRVSINNFGWMMIYWGKESDWSIFSGGYVVGLGETLPEAFEKAVLTLKGQ